HEAVKTAVQLQSDKLRDEAQAENADFINKFDDNIKKIIKDRKNLYKALVDAYERRLEELEMNQSQPVHQMKRPPRQLFQKPVKPPTLDRDWNKTLPATHVPVQPWLSTLAQKEDTRESFNELMDTLLDILAFVINRLKVDTLTLELLVGPTFELMKGSCKSLVELEYFFEEVYKTKAADYEHIKWIEDLVPNRMWSQVSVSYDKHALWGISHWGRKQQQFYGFAANRESARDVYSKRRIIAVTKLQIVEWNNYKHLDWITIHRDDDKLYTFKEGDSTGFASKTSKTCCNKDKKNRLMRIDELHKFCDGTLSDVRTALNDRLEGI
ncbi:hypothetical protein Tco_0490741, partial [Tanacetum coccineum]